MKIRILYMMMLISLSVSAQTWFTEDFSTSTFPPTDWSIDDNAENWKYSASNYAGGITGEASLRTLPIVDANTRLISPEINITNTLNTAISFTHSLKLYTSGATIGLAIKPENGEWTSLWERSSSTDKEKVDVLIADVGDFSNCQISFYFSGSTGTIKYWSIDDVQIYRKADYDIAVRPLNISSYNEPSDEVSPQTKVYNNGINPASFEVNCHIYKNEDLLFSSSQTVSDLEAGSEQEIQFDSYVLPDTPDEAYRIEYSASFQNDENNNNDTIEQYVYTYVTHERDMVVVEIGTATWCSACPYAAEAADSIVKNGYNLAVIEHHTDDDYSSVATDNRTIDYYAMIGFPTAYFDGVDKQLGAGPYFYSNYYNHYYQRSIKKVGLGISIEKKSGENDYEAKVTITKLAPAFNKEVVVHFVVTESHIPELWQDEDELNYVTRLMLPNENGSPIDIINNDEITLDYLVEPQENWKIDDMEVVAFIQDNATHEILNATKMRYSDLSGVSSGPKEHKTQLSVFPNPISSKLKISFELDKAADVNIGIYDITGRLRTNITHQRFGKGKQQIEYHLNNKLSNGVYFIRMLANNKTETVKIIINK